MTCEAIITDKVLHFSRVVARISIYSFDVVKADATFSQLLGQIQLHTLYRLNVLRSLPPCDSSHLALAIALIT